MISNSEELTKTKKLIFSVSCKEEFENLIFSVSCKEDFGAWWDQDIKLDKHVMFSLADVSLLWLNPSLALISPPELSLSLAKTMLHGWFYLFFLPPAKIRWIWSPRLKAWLNSSLVWNSETNGNQASTATGTKITNPIMYS